MFTPFDGSDSEPEIKTDNEYAKKYDNWRKKEELNKLKARYGDEHLDDLLEGSSSSSSEDDEAGPQNQWTADLERQFHHTLACLKNRDPSIYDDKVKFFEEAKSGSVPAAEQSSLEATKKPKNERSITEECAKNESSMYDDETEGANLNKVLSDSEDEEDAVDEQMKQYIQVPASYSNFELNEEHLIRLNTETVVENDDGGQKITGDVSDSDDEEVLANQEVFEHKFNFRYEDPDQEFMKRYPRTIENSLRVPDTKRKEKRAEIKARKQKEKEQKIQDLKKLQELKGMEIVEKVEKLKKVVGDDNIEFKDDDIDGDFDPEAHDRRMQALFNDDFYEGDESEKPEFPEIDEYLEIENWTESDVDKEVEGENKTSSVPHCEDDDFNMDCEYVPKSSQSQEGDTSSKGKKRKRKSLFAKAVSKPKPVFNPDDKTYAEYLDDYYEYDCEDIIDGKPCRFKYRSVLPNSFGLSIEEILMADDRELNKWCKLKRAVEYRPYEVQKYDQIAYEKKAANFERKREIFQSLFKTDEKKGTGEKNTKTEDVESSRIGDNPNNDTNELNVEKKKKKMELSAQKEPPVCGEVSLVESKDDDTKVKTDAVVNGSTKEKSKKKKKKKKKAKITTSSAEKPNGENTKEASHNKKKRKHSEGEGLKSVSVNSKKRKFDKKGKRNHGAKDIGITDARLSAYGINPKKFKNKKKYGPQQTQ